MDVFAVILAGGTGARMGNAEKPKQFMTISGKPILIHTLEKFCVCPDFREIIVLTPKQWMNHTRDLVRKYLPGITSVQVIEGGQTRNDTIMNSIRYIEDTHGLKEDTVIVTHDSVRPFVTHRIIQENIALAIAHGATDTVIPATDTIVESQNHRFISAIPMRDTMYQGQTPQSFNAKKLRDIFDSLTAEEKAILTDACKILVMKGEEVHLVEGEVFNIKITYPYDLRVAESMLGGDVLA